LPKNPCHSPVDRTRSSSAIDGYRFASPISCVLYSGMMIEQQITQFSSPLSLVLLPGLDGTGQLFKWFLDTLPSEFKPIVVSFAGDKDADYAALETHVVRFLPQDRPFAILGESFSGPLALRLAARGYENLVAVILVASFIAKPVAWVPDFVRHLLHPFIFRLPIQIPLLRWLLLGRNPPTALISDAVTSLRSVVPAVLAGRTKAALEVDAAEALAGCPVPILYLGGTQDRLISSQTAARMKALRPDLECVMLDAPHFLLQRAPTVAADAIARFLGRHYPLEANGSALTPP
jgi:pimeloyl-ACP methyl ester carboxylesterase